MSQTIMQQQRYERKTRAWPKRDPPPSAEPTHARPATRSAMGDRSQPPRGPFGGTNAAAAGVDGDGDDLRSRIAVLLGAVGAGREDSSYVGVLRTSLLEAREACRQGRLGLARHILFLVQGQ